MKWSEQDIEKLRELCNAGKSNKEIAEALECGINDIYAKRSQLGITIDKCKKTGQAPKEKAQKGLPKDVQNAFGKLEDELFWAMASDYTSLSDSSILGSLQKIIIDIKVTFDELMKEGN